MPPPASVISLPVVIHTALPVAEDVRPLKATVPLTESVRHGVVEAIPTLPLLLMMKLVAVEDPTTNWLLATPATGLIANVANGLVEPTPTMPLSKTLKRVVDALSTSSKRPPVPVPLAKTVNLEVGVVEPAAVLPIDTRG